MSCNKIYEDVVKKLFKVRRDESFKDSEGIIQLLSLYISQLPPTSDKTNQLKLEEAQKVLIAEFITDIFKRIEPCGSPGTRVEDKKTRKENLLDDIEHLVTHSARRGQGYGIADSVLKGLTDTLIEQRKRRNEPANSVKFDDVSKVRQAYWTRRKHPDPDKHRMHRTIRINGMPFAEGVLAYLMEYYANDFAINLDIIDIEWRDVGAALLSNKIDVAFYNDSIKKQMQGLHRLADGRLLFRTKEKAFEYQTYYFLSRTIASPPTEPNILSSGNGKEVRIAVVSNSDSEGVLRKWHELKTSPVIDLERIMVPVDTPDEALRLVVDGDDKFEYYCIAGGIHKDYAEKAFKDFIQDYPIPNGKITEVFFWTVTSRMDDSKRMLNDMISLWTQITDNWMAVKHGLGKEADELRSNCITYVNRQPNKAFIIDRCDKDPFIVLAELIDDHNKLCRLNVGDIKQDSVEGW